MVQRGAEGDVVADIEVREERGLLRGVGDLAKVGWDVCQVRFGAQDGCGGVGEQTAEGAECGAFAAAGRAEEDAPGGGEGEVEIEDERAELRGEAELVMVRGIVRGLRGQEIASCALELRE